METGENKEMETETEDALDPSSECTYEGEEHQLFLQLEPEALDITDIESQHSDQRDDKTTKTDEEKTEITTISSNFPQSSKIDIENESDDLVDPCDESLIPTCTIPSAHQDQDTMVHLDHFADPHILINMDNVGTVSRKSLEPEALDITDSESQHSDQQDDKTTKTDEEKTEITTSSNFAQSSKKFTIALIGGTDSMEIESGNLLLGQDDLPAAELSQIAPRMYDLFGRCVSVINMLGLQSSELTQENHIGPLVHKQGINAVLLLLPLGQHIDEFKMGVGWLERMLGERALAFTIIVFTHKNDQDFGLGDLKDNNDLMDLIEMCGNRYLTCKKTMNDPAEISTLLEQIDLMVSENDPCCYTGEMYDEEIRKQLLKTDWGDRSQSEEKTASGMSSMHLMQQL